MTPFCPHCTAELLTYTTVVDREPTNIEVLVCAHCDKVLGVAGQVGPARDEDRRIDVHAVADLLNVAMNTDDEGEALTVFTVAIGQINSEIGKGDDGSFTDMFERILRAYFEKQRQQKEQRDQADADRDRPQ